MAGLVNGKLLLPAKSHPFTTHHSGVETKRDFTCAIRAAGIDDDYFVAKAERRQAGVEPGSCVFSNQHCRERGVGAIGQGVIPYNPANLQAAF